MQRSTNLNMYLPGNGDPQDITQISWNFDTLDGEVLTKSAQTLTSSQKTQIRTNLGLGGSATASVANNLTTTSSGSVLDARVGPLVAQSIYLSNDDDTWSEIWTKLNALSSGKPAVIYMTSTAMDVLSDGAITSGSWHGTIARTSSSAFSLMLKSNGNTIRACTISGAAATRGSTFSFTFDTVYQPKFLNIAVAQATATTFKIAENSKIRIDFVTQNVNRMGTALIARVTGNVFARTDLGSNLTLTTSSDSITVTSTGGATAMQCTIYQGDITEATT